MGIERVQITTKAGNSIDVFYNPDTNLLVVDLCDKSGKGGNEITRRTLDETKLLEHVNS